MSNPKKTSADKVDVKSLKTQIDELTLALQRERADATNIRRRHDEELASSRSHQRITVIKELLPVIDNFERALAHVPKELEDNSYIKGVQVVVKQFEKTLEKLGVTRIKTTGEHFDPHYHEAVSMDESGGGSKEIISEELQSGYKLDDKVIRHAMVKVKMVK